MVRGVSLPAEIEVERLSGRDERLQVLHYDLAPRLIHLFSLRF